MDEEKIKNIIKRALEEEKKVEEKIKESENKNNTTIIIKEKEVKKEEENKKDFLPKKICAQELYRYIVSYYKTSFYSVLILILVYGATIINDTYGLVMTGIGLAFFLYRYFILYREINYFNNKYGFEKPQILPNIKQQ